MSGFESELVLTTAIALPVLMTWIAQNVIHSVLQLGQRALRQCLKRHELGHPNRRVKVRR